MSKLQIHTTAKQVVIVGQFCDWNVENSILAQRKKGSKSIIVENMPIGEYKVLADKTYKAAEIYPTDTREMPNRYFSGEANEVICVYF